MTDILNAALAAKFNATFDAPTPIQTAVWERLSAGESIFGLAPTGSGKTLAFVLPLLSQIEGTGTQVLIVAPSQELAAQTTQVAREWANLVDVKVTSLIGGANGRRQTDTLRKTKPAIVVGTVGRILTMLDSGALKLDQLRSLVIDEADALLHEERDAEWRALSSYVPRGTQVALFSATDGVDLAKVQQLFGQSTTPISVGQDAPKQITHEYQFADERGKAKILAQIARKQRALVFFNQVSALTNMEATLRHNHVPVASLGSNDRRQIQRADALASFRKGDVKLLLVTDVAARGLDIVDLPMVINAQIPRERKTYVHRAGRTGRMGKTGVVLNLGNDHDLRDVKRLLGDDVDLVKANLAPEKPVVRAKEEVREAVKVVAKTAAKSLSARPSKEKASTTPTEVDVKKKPRSKQKQKNQKDKGMRHKRRKQAENQAQ